MVLLPCSECKLMTQLLLLPVSCGWCRVLLHTQHPYSHPAPTNQATTLPPCHPATHLELLEGELRDRLGVAPAVLHVRVVWEEGRLRDAVVHRVGRGVDTLHLVEHDPLVGQGGLQAGGISRTAGEGKESERQVAAARGRRERMHGEECRWVGAVKGLKGF